MPSQRRLGGPAGLLLVIAALLALPRGSAARAAAVIEAGVMDKVEAGPHVVVVLLDEGAVRARAGSLAPWSAPPLRAAIAATQDDVTAALPEGSWQPRYRYALVPALTGVATADAVKALAADPRVARIGLDRPGQGGAAEALAFVGVPEFRADYGADGAGVTIAIFDTGIDTDHPDFAGRITVGGRFVNQGQTGADVEDHHGHGTVDAGIAAGGGAVAPTGVAPGAQLLVYKVLDDSNAGWASDWAAAADHAAANIALWPTLRVATASIGTSATFEECPCTSSAAWFVVLALTYANLADAGVLVTTSTQNYGARGSLPTPACLDSTLAVGAVHEADRGRSPLVGSYRNSYGTSFGDCADATSGPDALACFTCVSECLDILAPGVQIQSVGIGGGSSGNWTGTSMATPMVAGAAATLFELLPDATAADVRAVLLETGVPVDVSALSAGATVVPRLDLAAAGAALGASCGDGLVRAPEGCDDGDTSDGDCCSAACQPAADLDPCDDGDPCTDDDACLAGVCGGQPADCDDGDPCTTDACDPAEGCTSPPAPGAPCDDGLFCTTADRCDDDGLCAGAPVLPEDGVPCTADTCDEAADAFVHTPADAACDDGDPCTDDACDPTEGCVHTDNTAPCEDGDPCTTGDACAAGECSAGALRTCDDGDPCTDDACVAGTCAHDAVPGCCAADADCDDADPCTADRCDAGACAHGPGGACGPDASGTEDAGGGADADSGEPDVTADAGFGEPDVTTDAGSGAPDVTVDAGFGEPDATADAGSGAPDVPVDAGSGDPDAPPDTGSGAPDVAPADTGAGGPDVAPDTGAGTPDVSADTGATAPDAPAEPDAASGPPDGSPSAGGGCAAGAGGPSPLAVLLLGALFLGCLRRKATGPRRSAKAAASRRT